MRGIMNTLLIWAAVALIFTTGGCKSGEPAGPPITRVGVVDPQRILNETSAGKKARETLASFTKNRQALIELEEKELRRLEEDFVKQGSVLSPTAKREREEQFRRRMAEYQQKVTELNREVQDKQKDVLDGFRDKIEAVAAKIAKRHDVQLIIDRGRGGPTIYFEESVDLSAQVIEEFNREFP